MAVSTAESQANIQSLVGQGYTQEQISQFNYGKKLNPTEMQAFQAQYKPTPTVGQQVQTGIQALGSQEYQFDPNKYLPAIQQQASAIYSPQQAQLEAIRQLQNTSAQDTRVQTEKDFSKRLQSEVEAINRRGAFFSGGAIQNEQDIRSSQQSALTQLDLQTQAANYSNLASQAQLQAEQSQFIQDRLVNSESGAYARWSDQRNFSMQALQTQYQVYSAERDFARNVFESDRNYGLQTEQLKLQKAQAAMQEKQFKQQYKLDDLQFKQAKEQFTLDMKIKNLSYSQALDNFKKKYATNNSGALGLDSNGNDIEQQLYDSYQVNIPAENSSNGQAGVFSIDTFINGQ